jgi:hypothetical protein
MNNSLVPRGRLAHRRGYAPLGRGRSPGAGGNWVKGWVARIAQGLNVVNVSVADVASTEVRLMWYSAGNTLG